MPRGEPMLHGYNRGPKPGETGLTSGKTRFREALAEARAEEAARTEQRSMNPDRWTDEEVREMTAARRELDRIASPDHPLVNARDGEGWKEAFLRALRGDEYRETFLQALLVLLKKNHPKGVQLYAEAMDIVGAKKDMHAMVAAALGMGLAEAKRAVEVQRAASRSTPEEMAALSARTLREALMVDSGLMELPEVKALASAMVGMMPDGNAP